jgi:hypothetical protein
MKTLQEKKARLASQLYRDDPQIYYDWYTVQEEILRLQGDHEKADFVLKEKRRFCYYRNLKCVNNVVTKRVS